VKTNRTLTGSHVKFLSNYQFSVNFDGLANPRNVCIIGSVRTKELICRSWLQRFRIAPFVRTLLQGDTSWWWRGRSWSSRSVWAEKRWWTTVSTQEFNCLRGEFFVVSFLWRACSEILPGCFFIFYIYKWHRHTILRGKWENFPV
jgi:hypothetical protein